MNKNTSPILGITLAGGLALSAGPAKADSFGSGPNAFTIGFVSIGNPGNANDAPFDNTFPGFSAPHGAVAYSYRMGVTEAAQDWITKATNLGLTNVLAGPWAASQPATYMTWYEAAAFVNWLNTSTGHQAAYNLTFSGSWSMALWSSAQAWQAGGENLYRNKGAYYFLPSEDEWYKAAFHKNDGVTANYWDYATGSNTIPTAVASGTAAGSAVYNQPFDQGPAAVNNPGGLSPYGTRGQDGNVSEWEESAWDGSNDSPTEDRSMVGGGWAGDESQLRPTGSLSFGPLSWNEGIGFRVASVPEPSCAVLMMGPGLMLVRRRRPGVVL